MLPSRMNVPREGLLETVRVAEGLYVVKDAYSRRLDYFETSALYLPKQRRSRPEDVKPVRVAE